MGQWLSERLGRPVIVENRPGGGGNIAIEAVVKALADGHTLPLVTIQSAVNATLYDKLNYNFIRDIAPVASISRQTLALAVTPSFPARTVPDIIAYAKANPGRLSMASAGNGTTPHVAGELFKMMAGVDMPHVPLSRRVAGADRSHRQTGAGDLCRHRLVADAMCIRGASVLHPHIA